MLCFGVSLKDVDAFFFLAAVQPAESFRRVVQFPQSRVTQINFVEIRDKGIE